MYQWIKVIVILPVNAIIVLPAFLLYFTDYTYSPPSFAQMIIGVVLFFLGLTLAITTMYLFETIGRGTAAPWHPPQNLVIKGPYRHVRNPMLSSVLMIILAAAIFLSSYVLLIYFVFFWILNTAYFYYFEERTLEKRFKESYREYKKNVPRWIPKFRAYNEK